jgi:galactokinase
MARIGQLTEHNHVGVNCGIMDQFINLHGEERTVLKLDCRSLEYDRYLFLRDDIKIVLCNSNVSHNLASSEYNIRRNQCEEGIEHLQRFESGVKNLRDVSYQMLEDHKDGLRDLIYKRCKFVLDENQRVLDACSDLQREDYELFGERMYASHYGLSNDYEVSCTELDVLVDIAKKLPGVFGSRMMGGGFGGCTVNLVQEEHVEAFQASVSKEYRDRTGLETEIYITQISHGASVVEKSLKVKTD